MGHEDIRPSAIVVIDGITCHSTVVRGMVVFHNDCANGWAGKEVKLEEF